MPAVEEGGRNTASRASGNGVAGNRSFAPKVQLASWSPKQAAPSSAPHQEARPLALGPVQHQSAPSFLRPTAQPFRIGAVSDARDELMAAVNAPSPVKSTFEASVGTGGLAAPDWAKDSNTGRDNTIRTDMAKTNLDLAERTMREQTIGNDKPHGEVKPMTWEEYNALSQTERAAVDFNTMLVRAVRRDHNLQDDYDPNKQQQQTYDQSVEKMFGEDRGSDLYAPETLAVLRQIDFKDDKADLDDFLSLKAAITAKDLKKNLDTVVGFWTAGTDAAATPAVDRAGLVQNLADSTREAQEKVLAQGNELLASINQTTLVERNEDVQRFLGGIRRDPSGAAGMGATLGYGPEKVDPTDGHPLDLNTYFQQVFDTAAASTGNAKGAESVLATDLANGVISQQDVNAFHNYADVRSLNAEQFDQPLGDTSGVKYHSPEEFRKMFGLDQGGSRG